LADAGRGRSERADHPVRRLRNDSGKLSTDATDISGKAAQIRAVHALVRQDGRLSADISMCVFSEDELPDLERKDSA
jgi:hypothetical protein